MGSDNNKTRVWKISEMDADHVNRLEQRRRYGHKELSDAL